jgi:methionyl-tRNA formyltransferase
MKIGYFADGPWSHKALEALAGDSTFSIVFIVPRFDTQDPVLSKWATKLGIDYIPIANVNMPDALEVLQKYNADIFVSMSFNQIMRKAFLSLPPMGVINCHAGALPFYRGRNILNWALINGEESFGVTVHYVDEGIDTGDIVAQKMIPIKVTDSYGTLLHLAIEECGALLYQSLKEIASATATVTEQASIHPVGSYFCQRRDGDEYIDWNWPSSRIFNFVRSISAPGPLARALLGEQLVFIDCAELIPDAIDYIATSGEVIKVTQRGLIVKTGDSIILIRLNDPEGLTKCKVGSRFKTASFDQYLKLLTRVESLEKAISDVKARLS